MLKQPTLTDDLFEKSSMSFGEHLEELRKALVKAFLWLALGTGIGLFFATSVVKFIENPLRAELENFYLKQTAARFKSINGVDPPKELVNWMAKYSVIPERVFIDPAQLRTPGEAASGNVITGAPSAASTGDATPAREPTPAGTPTPAGIPTPTGTPASTGTPAGGNTSPVTQSGSGKTVAEGASSADVNLSVWKDLSAESLQRLQPLLIMRPIPNRLMTFDALEGFLIWLKAGLLVGAIIASPAVFYHIWEFLAAGLYPHERRYVYLYLPLSVILFIAGVSLAFFVIFKLVLAFLLTYNADMDIDFAPRLKDYISFALFLPLGFGIAFQLPIVMLGLNRFGIVPTEMYVSKWRLAVLGIAFLSMVLTPADAYSMVGMFVPLTLLYFLGIALCKYMPKGPGVGSQAFDPA